MAASDDDDYGAFEREKPAEEVKKTTDEVKNTVKEDAQHKGMSVRDKAKDLKQQVGETVGKGQEKLAPVLATAKEKVDKLEGKKPVVQEEAKEMLDQAKHSVSRVVQQESRDVVEGMKRLAKDEKAFHDAAHKVVDKLHGGGSTTGDSGKKQENLDSNQQQQEHHQQQQHQHAAHQIPDFSDFSEMEEEEDWSDEGEGSSHPKQHLLNDHRHHEHPHEHPHKPHKRKKSPLGFFKAGAKFAGKDKNKQAAEKQQGEHQPPQQQQQQEEENGGHGVLGTVKSVFGQGSQGEKSMDVASNLAQKKLAQMRHVVDAQMDQGGNATAAEKKTQGVGLVQSFVCLCTCASSVHVSG